MDKGCLWSAQNASSLVPISTNCEKKKPWLYSPKMWKKEKEITSILLLLHTKFSFYYTSKHTENHNNQEKNYFSPEQDILHSDQTEKSETQKNIAIVLIAFFGLTGTSEPENRRVTFFFFPVSFTTYHHESWLINCALYWPKPALLAYTALQIKRRSYLVL